MNSFESSVNLFESSVNLFESSVKGFMEEIFHFTEEIFRLTEEIFRLTEEIIPLLFIDFSLKGTVIVYSPVCFIFLMILFFSERFLRFFVWSELVSKRAS